MSSELDKVIRSWTAVTKETVASIAMRIEAGHSIPRIRNWIAQLPPTLRAHLFDAFIVGKEGEMADEHDAFFKAIIGERPQNYVDPVEAYGEQELASVPRTEAEQRAKDRKEHPKPKPSPAFPGPGWLAPDGKFCACRMSEHSLYDWLLELHCYPDRVYGALWRVAGYISITMALWEVRSKVLVHALRPSAIRLSICGLLACSGQVWPDFVRN